MKNNSTNEFRVLVMRLENMMKVLQAHKYDIAVNREVDLSWYIQKTETLKFLSKRMNDMSGRMNELKSWMNKECHDAVRQLETDHRALLKIGQAPETKLTINKKHKVCG